MPRPGAARGRSPRTQHASGSTSVAAASLTPSGIEQHVARRVLGRHEDPLGEAAGMDARALERLAQRLVPAPAQLARPARHVVVHEDALARRGQLAPRPAAPVLDHDADRLVPEHERRARLDVPAHEVRAADAARAHRDEHLARAGLRHVALLHADRAARLVDRRPHAAVAVAERVGDRRVERRAQHAGVADDRGDERGGGDVEGGVPDRHVVGQPGGDADLGARALLDVDRGALGRRGVERRARHGDVERDAVVVGGDRERVGADLVRGVAVGGDAVGADDHGVDVAAREPRRRGALGQHGHRDARRAGAPRRSAARPAAAGASRTRAPRSARPRRPSRRRRRARCPSRRWPGGRCCRASAAGPRARARRGRARRSAGTPRGPPRGSPAPPPRRRRAAPPRRARGARRRARGRPPRRG